MQQSYYEWFSPKEIQMSEEADRAAADVIQTAQAEFAAIRARSPELVAELASTVAGMDDSARSYHGREIVEGLMDSFASDAANRLADEDDQDNAIGKVEEWFSANVDHEDPETVAVASISAYGEQEAREKIRERLEAGGFSHGFRSA